MTRYRMRQAIVSALEDAMTEDDSVVLLGEDVGAAGGVFKATEGLQKRFGAGRVRDTPISEMAFLGAGVGAACTGLRPVIEIMYMEFLGVALDQLSTQAAKLRYLSAGRLRTPLTVRASIGAGGGFGAQHSQGLETWLYATPGLKLAVASGPASAYGLLRSAIRDDNPVVVLEPRRLYPTWEEFEPGDDAIIELGRARTLRQGDDVTIVALGSMVPVATEAADSLGKGVSAEVIDLQTLIPWDRDAVMASVRRTGRLVIVEESPFSGGWGTEIAAWISSHAFGELTAPVLRVTCPDVPIPFARELEARYLPSAGYVAAQVTALLDTGRLPENWWERSELTHV
jgi:acetoin:2,6-dichlorophenolindophenol oxidoreductase subunit beta